MFCNADCPGAPNEKPATGGPTAWPGAIMAIVSVSRDCCNRTSSSAEAAYRWESTPSTSGATASQRSSGTAGPSRCSKSINSAAEAAVPPSPLEAMAPSVSRLVRQSRGAVPSCAKT
eukprot:CAMPEP_0171144478 /NCGR_PEP_ID=MMETSP0766_2-20121228/145988_1 /TAXON_ID=439317 /ORGANISM="Gambierdiscus australes, Strain CAWD 149" /LENGTH=116 /DNA_ID=CAMNT_0011608337 /DNA_START=42 /DNA_END=388 /DNA_ORIENTATION=+